MARPRGDQKFPEKDHSVIEVHRGKQEELALLYDIAPSTVSKWLNGHYLDSNQNPLIDIVRERARKMQDGIVIYVARHRDGGLQAFHQRPRRNHVTGRYHDPSDILWKTNVADIPFTYDLMPDGVEVDWETNRIATLVIRPL